MPVDTENKYTLCPKFTKTFGILGRKWNGLIIEVLLEKGPQRFRNLGQSVYLFSVSTGIKFTPFKYIFESILY